MSSSKRTHGCLGLPHWEGRPAADARFKLTATLTLQEMDKTVFASYRPRGSRRTLNSSRRLVDENQPVSGCSNSVIF